MKLDLKLKETLDELYESYTEDFRTAGSDFFLKRPDPIQFPHRYATFHDREAAAFLAATFAYGNVKSLCGFVDRLLTLLGPSPHAFLKQGPKAVAALAPHRPYYRLHKTAEILWVLSALARVYQNHDSLYAVFLKTYDGDSTMKQSVSRFVAALRGMVPGDLRFLIPSPEDGSPCKRLNLFFRWMVRRGSVDFGLWKEVPPSLLIVPLDTHIGRVAYRLGWIGTPSLSWQKAETVTSVLRRYDPDDPTRYDFALCHESIQRSAWLQGVLTGKTQRRKETKQLSSW